MKITYNKADEKLFREYAEKNKVSSEVLKLYFEAYVSVDMATIVEAMFEIEDKADEQYVAEIKANKLWKLQRPLFTNRSYNDVLAYEVDDDGGEVDNGTHAIIPMPKKAIKTLFHDDKFAKVYYVGEVKDEKLDVSVNLPVLKHLWV